MTVPFEYHHANHHTSSGRKNVFLHGSVFEGKINVGDNPAWVKAPKCVVSKYDPEYFKFGFIMACGVAEIKAHYVECGEILSGVMLSLSLIYFWQ